jgi:hypothetical protein
MEIPPNSFRRGTTSTWDFDQCQVPRKSPMIINGARVEPRVLGIKSHQSSSIHWWRPSTASFLKITNNELIDICMQAKGRFKIKFGVLVTKRVHFRTWTHIFNKITEGTIIAHICLEYFALSLWVIKIILNNAHESLCQVYKETAGGERCREATKKVRGYTYTCPSPPQRDRKRQCLVAPLTSLNLRNVISRRAYHTRVVSPKLVIMDVV